MRIAARKLAIFLITIVLWLLISACSIFRETPSIPKIDPKESTPVSTDQIAQAMQNDEFYSDYRGMILSVQADVLSINQQGGHWLAEIKTSERTQVYCDFGTNEPAVKAGDTIRVLTIASDARRETGAVILSNCVVQ